MGLTSFYHIKFGALTALLLSQIGIVGSASECPRSTESSLSGAALHAKQEFAAVAVKPELGAAAALKQELGAAMAPSSTARGRGTPAAALDASTCFDLACLARAPRAQYNAKRRGLRLAECCPRAAVAGSCAVCLKPFASQARLLRQALCDATRAPPEGLLPKGLPGLSGGGGSWREVDSASVRGRHSSPESRPPVLKLSVKLGWFLAESAPKDFFMRVDFASALAARRAGGGPSCGEVAWLFVARFLKWPAAVSKLQVYATIACDAFAERHQSQDVATAAEIMESVARVLQDLSGHPCPTIHVRVSSNRRTHSATGIIVACALSRAAPQAWRESGSRGGRSGAELGSGSVAMRV